jgi:acetyltransferase-like isoleucine patch superfamily enzyme
VLCFVNVGAGRHFSRGVELISHAKLKLGLNLVFSSRLFSFPGFFKLRQLFYRWAFGFREVKVGEDVWFTDIHKPTSELLVGRNVVFQKNSMIDCSARVEIADNVVFSRGAIVFTHAHNIHNKSGSWRIQGETVHPIQIRTDVWVGARAMIMPSVSMVGEGAIIGAGSVVVKDVEPYTIVAGNPAHVIGKRE